MFFFLTLVGSLIAIGLYHAATVAMAGVSNQLAVMVLALLSSWFLFHFISQLTMRRIPSSQIYIHDLAFGFLINLTTGHTLELANLLLGTKYAASFDNLPLFAVMMIISTGMITLLQRQLFSDQELSSIWKNRLSRNKIIARPIPKELGP